MSPYWFSRYFTMKSKILGVILARALSPAGHSFICSVSFLRFNLLLSLFCFLFSSDLILRFIVTFLFILFHCFRDIERFYGLSFLASLTTTSLLTVVVFASCCIQQQIYIQRKRISCLFLGLVSNTSQFVFIDGHFLILFTYFMLKLTFICSLFALLFLLFTMFNSNSIARAVPLSWACARTRKTNVPK